MGKKRKRGSRLDSPSDRAQKEVSAL